MHQSDCTVSKIRLLFAAYADDVLPQSMITGINQSHLITFNGIDLFITVDKHVDSLTTAMKDNKINYNDNSSFDAACLST